MRVKSSALIIIALIAISVPAMAENVTVVHGIPGSDLGLPNELAVDISVDGACAAPGVEFTDVAGPLPVAPGLYDVEVRLASAGTSPCTGLLVIAETLSVRFGEDVSVVAHLTLDGTITLSKFVNDVRAVDAGNGRLIIRHLADAPEVGIVFSTGGPPMPLVSSLENPQQAKLEVAADDYLVGVRVPGVGTVGPIPLTVGTDTTTIVYAIGTLSSGSFTVAAQVIALN